ncbi:MAG: hypothetical protein ABIJ96_06350 [Elusimicrobiota bacterium]
MRLLLPLLALSAVLSLPAAAAPPEVDTHILNAIQAIWAMDFSASEASLEKAKAALPEYPYPYFGQANVTWLRYVYGSQRTDTALQKKFEGEVEQAVAAAETWLRAHPRDAEGYLALSGSYGLRARLATIQKRWLRALLDGRKAVKFTRQAHRLDPELHDALLGAGMYDYYADSLPRTVKFFSKLILGGDRERGIRSLKTVAEKGRYAKIAAQLLLIEVYTEDRWGARDPAEAVRIIQALRTRFPKSPVFHKIEQVCLYEAERYDEVSASAREYTRRIDDGWAYYLPQDRARMCVTEGTARFAQNRLEPAHDAYQRAGALAGTAEKPERWGVWGLVRLGQVRDLLNRRPEALQAYGAAGGFADIWGFRAAAKRGLRAPHLSSSEVGQLPPP